jgi:molecular chaperone GrpE (heat shock protein)
MSDEISDEKTEDGHLEAAPVKTEAEVVASVLTGLESERESGGNAAGHNHPAAPYGDAQLVRVMAEVSDQLREINRISEERERIIDRLHQENQKLKQGELQQVLLPVFRDLIKLYDDLKITATYYASRDGQEKTAAELNCYRETVGDILYRYGVEQIEVAVSESFNPKEHKAVATVPSADVERDRIISKIVRDGFKTDLRVIRNVEVEVYRYVAPETESAGQAQAASEAKSKNQEAQ